MPQPQTSVFNHPISISQQYLIQNSQSIEQVNTYYIQQNMEPLTKQYKSYLTSVFNNLNQHYILFQNDDVMKATATINCKMELDMFLMDKLVFLLSKETQPIAKIVLECARNYKENIEDMESILIYDRKKKIQHKSEESQRIINNLKKQVLIKRDYVKDLQDRIKELEEQNSEIFSKIIGNAKTTINNTLMNTGSASKSLSNIKGDINLNSAVSQQMLKLKNQLDHTHKTLSMKQVEQMINDILESKRKKQSIKANTKHLPIEAYLNTYFRFKFGMKNLAEETQVNFKDALLYFARTHQKSSIILFQKILDEECQQSYYFQHRAFHEKLIKQIKRYVNEKQKIPLQTLDRIYDIKAIEQKSDVLFNQTDIKYVLINVYKSKEIDTLQMIFNEIMDKSHALNQSDMKATQNGQLNKMIPSKKLINELLNYELKKHMIKIQDLTKQIKSVQNIEKYITFQDLETIVLELKISQEKLDLLVKNFEAWKDKTYTFSETIEIIYQIKKYRPSQITSNTRR